MGILNVFKKKRKNKRDIKNMPKTEKKKFLSNDLIDRMIRVEQRVSASLGEHKPYNKTDYYKSLTESEKKNYEHYRKKSSRNLNLFLFFSLLFLVILVAVRVEFSGNIIHEFLGDTTFSLLPLVLMLVFVCFLFIWFIYSTVKMRQSRRFNRHFDALDEIGIQRYTG